MGSLSLIQYSMLPTFTHCCMLSTPGEGGSEGGEGRGGEGGRDGRKGGRERGREGKHPLNRHTPPYTPTHTHM